MDNLGKNKIRGESVNEISGTLINENIVTKLYGESVQVDLSKPIKERIIRFVESVSRPNKIMHEDYEIELAFSDTERTIQECIQELLTRI